MIDNFGDIHIMIFAKLPITKQESIIIFQPTFFEQSDGPANWENLDPMLLYALVATQKRRGMSSERLGDQEKINIQCKSECTKSGSTFQHLC